MKRRFARCLFTAALGWAASHSSALHAGLPAPDQLIYGTIKLDGRLVTALNPAVVVQARRTLAGPPIATYPMGSAPEAGGVYYVLRLTLESPPVLQTTNSQVGDSFFIVVTDSAVIREIRTVQITEWGGVARLDFGQGLDADGNGISDSWEQINGSGSAASDIDNDQLPKLAEYIAGTNPNDPASIFYVDVASNPVANEIVVSFLARAAEGFGYEGSTRFYSLETSTNLLLGGWRTVNDYDAIVGRNQTVLFLQPRTNPPAFYRGRVWLRGP